jgi:hypothetical protein
MLETESLGSGARGATLAVILAIIWLSRPSRPPTVVEDEGVGDVGVVGEGVSSGNEGSAGSIGLVWDAPGLTFCAVIMASYRSYASSSRGVDSCAGDGGREDIDTIESGRGREVPPSEIID